MGSAIICAKLRIFLAEIGKVATADVRVRVRSVRVVDVESPIIQVLVIVTAGIQTRVRRVKVPVIREHAKALD